MYVVDLKHTPFDIGWQTRLVYGNNIFKPRITKVYNQLNSKVESTKYIQQTFTGQFTVK